jgi:hypothetical protein
MILKEIYYIFEEKNFYTKKYTFLGIFFIRLWKRRRNKGRRKTQRESTASTKKYIKFFNDSKQLN